MRPSRVRASLLAALLVLGAAGAAVFGASTPAAAHDSLLGADPAAGSTVADLPAQITLTFSAPLTDGFGGNVVAVTTAAGASLSAGETQVVDNTLIQPLEGTASGAVTVTWRAVSSDGHPIDGAFSFTVAGATTPTPTATPSPTTPAPATAAPTTTESATPAPAPADAAGVPWLIVSIAAVAALLVAVVVLLLLRRRPRSAPGGDAQGPGVER